jgi:hypothetical protein
MGIFQNLHVAAISGNCTLQRASLQDRRGFVVPAFFVFSIPVSMMP